MYIVLSMCSRLCSNIPCQRELCPGIHMFGLFSHIAIYIYIYTYIHR